MMEFSAHSRERMYELGVPQCEVERIVLHPERWEFKANCVQFFGLYEGRRVRVAVDAWDDKVITVSYVDTIRRFGRFADEKAKS